MTLIEGGCYLGTCVCNVELNPVRAGLVSQAKNYAYSSVNEPKPSEISNSAGCVPDAVRRDGINLSDPSVRRLRRRVAGRLKNPH